MKTPLHKPFSILLPFLLAITTLTAGAPARAAHNALQTVPEELMSAFLAASSQPFHASADGYRAHSGGLDFTFRASGLHAIADGLAWSLALRGWGRGEEIEPVSEPEIVQTDRRLEYRRGALTEWYRDTAAGVEQSLTLSQALRGAGPLVMQFELSTDLAGALDVDGRGLSFASPEGRTVRYSHLRAWDANTVPLDAQLLYSPGQILLQVNDQYAAYPITIDPLIYIEHRVVASGGEAEDNFGYSVALSGDTALVGAWSANSFANSFQGAAYVFTRSGTTWSLQQALTASDGGANDCFGVSVALSGDTALVGAYGGDVGENPDQGSAYVFTRSGTTWNQQAKLTASDGAAYGYFGNSVALSGDTALVGAERYNVGAKTYQGSAYVFIRSGTNWTQQAKLTASDGRPYANFGNSVALAADTAVVGAVGDDIGASEQGSAYVFTRSGTTWTQQAKLIASDGAAYGTFGYSVALFTDTALDGAAYDSFGVSVALSGDIALVGAQGADGWAIRDQGSAYVFTRSGTTWTQQAKLTASDGAFNDSFGNSVALSGDTVLVGAKEDDIGLNTHQGSAYFYDRWTGLTYDLNLPLLLKSAP